MSVPEWSFLTSCSLRSIPPEPTANDLYGPYSHVLRELIPPRWTMRVSPLINFEPAKPDGPVGFCGSYSVVDLTNLDVEMLVLEMRLPSTLSSSAGRKGADAHIRQRIAKAMPKTPLGTYHAVCAIGTRLCFYTGTMRDGEVHIEPPVGPDSNDPAPMSRWGCDVEKPEGITRLRAVVEEINAMYPSSSDIQTTPSFP